MFEKLNNLETGIIKGKQVEDLLDILAIDYFDSVIREDSVIVYNYKNFHSIYGSLLNAAISDLHITLKELQESFNGLYNEYQNQKKEGKNNE